MRKARRSRGLSIKDLAKATGVSKGTIQSMETDVRKPDQIIQPYQFGHHVRKATCLWLKGLPPLVPTNVVDPGELDEHGFTIGGALRWAVDENGKTISWNNPRTAKARSRTFSGIAKAMSEQWG